MSGLMVYSLLVVSCAGEDYSRVYGSFKQPNVQDEEVVTGSTSSTLLEELEFLTEEQFPAINSQASSVTSSSSSLHNHRLDYRRSENTPSSKPSEMIRKRTGRLQSIPYHGPFTKYKRLKAGYLESEELKFPDKYNEDFKSAQKEGQQLNHYHTPFKETTSIFLESDYINDFKSDQPHMSQNSFDKNIPEDVDDIRYKIPKNHKHSRLHMIPYHRPFAKSVFLRAGYLEEPLKNEPSGNGGEVVTQPQKVFEGISEDKGGGELEEQRKEDKLPFIPQHSPFSKLMPQRSGYVDDTHEVVVIVKKTTSAVVTRRFTI